MGSRRYSKAKFRATQEALTDAEKVARYDAMVILLLRVKQRRRSGLAAALSAIGTPSAILKELGEIMVWGPE